MSMTHRHVPRRLIFDDDSDSDDSMVSLIDLTEEDNDRDRVHEPRPEDIFERDPPSNHDHRGQIYDLMSNWYRLQNEYLQREVDTYRQRCFDLQERLDNSNRTRNDLNQALLLQNEQLELESIRVESFCLGIENFLHLSMQSERQLLVEQLARAFELNHMDLGDTLSDLEEW